MGKVVITKVGDEPLKESPKEVPVKSAIKGSARKTQKTFPKGILKVTDPAKAPPKRKSTHKQTIQLVTEKGSKKYRKTLKKKIGGLSDARIKQLVEKNGLLKNPNTPVDIQRQMVEGGVVAGFISL